MPARRASSRRRRKPSTRCRQGRRHPQPRLAGCWPAPSRAPSGKIAAKVVQMSLDHRLHNGWSMDYQGLPPVDVMIDCEPRPSPCSALLEALGPGRRRAALPATPRAMSKPVGRQDHRRSYGRRAAPRSRRPRISRSPMSRCPGTAQAGAAAPSARLSRLRWRRRGRRRARHLGRRARWR